DVELPAMAEAERLAYPTDAAAAVKAPYFVTGCISLLVAGVFRLVKLPEITEAETESESSQRASRVSVLGHKPPAIAAITQLFYVGAQVCVTSFFIRMAQQGAGVDERTAGYYLGIYGLLFMGGRFVGTFLLRYTTADRLLALYALVCGALAAVAVLGSGMVVLYALGGLGFFMSIMFPTIFSLGIAGLGKETKQASSWLIMAIVGGAIFPYI